MGGSNPEAQRTHEITINLKQDGNKLIPSREAVARPGYLRTARSMVTNSPLWSTLNLSETDHGAAGSTSAGKAAAAIHEVHPQKTLASPINWRTGRSYVSFQYPTLREHVGPQTRREAQSGHGTPPYPSRCRQPSCGSGQFWYLHRIRPVPWHPQAFEVRYFASFHNPITGRERAW